MALKLPLTLRRNRTRTIIIHALLISGVFGWLIFGGGFTGTQTVLLAVAGAVFILSLGFNLFLISEETYKIYPDRIECVSRLLPKDIVEAKDITRVEYTSDKKGVTVFYDRPEYNLKAFLADTGEGNDKTGMWSLTLRKEDINVPVGDLKFVLNSLLLSREVRAPGTKDDD